MRLSIPGGSRPAHYDRNPTVVNRSFIGTLNEGAGSVTQFTYTVPSGKKAFVHTMETMLLGKVLAATVVDNDKVMAYFAVDAGLAAFSSRVKAMLHSDSYTRGQLHEVHLAPSFPLPAGELLDFVTIFQGTAAGAGRVECHASMSVVEFDA